MTSKGVWGKTARLQTADGYSRLDDLLYKGGGKFVGSSSSTDSITAIVNGMAVRPMKSALRSGY